MSVRLVRAVVVPVLLVVVAALAVLTSVRAPQDEPGEETAPPLPEPLGTLWAAWGDDLASAGDGSYPLQLAALDRSEALYVLLTVRAAQIAEAAARGGESVPLADALDAAGLAPQPSDVPLEQVPDVPGCIVIRHPDDPYGRSFFGWADAPPEPGPEPQSALEEVLLRTSGVGLLSTDAATCGAGVAYSPQAQLALEELSPALLLE
jgi:hypothetical protein